MTILKKRFNVEDYFEIREIFFLQKVTYILSFNIIELIQDGIKSKTW